MTDWYKLMAIDIPNGEVDGLRVEKFEVVKNVEFARMMMRGRGTSPGWYTKLVDKHHFWMSDTTAEKHDHLEPVFKAEETKAERILINGLGLGMVLKAFLTMDHVKHIDVVEADERVIKLIGPHYTTDPRVNIIHADAYEQTKNWTPGTRWDIGWSDIWPDRNPDDLPLMAKLNRSYARRCGWHGCWSQSDLQALVRRERAHDRKWGG